MVREAIQNAIGNIIHDEILIVSYKIGIKLEVEGRVKGKNLHFSDENLSKTQAFGEEYWEV